VGTSITVSAKIASAGLINTVVLANQSQYDLTNIMHHELSVKEGFDIFFSSDLRRARTYFSYYGFMIMDSTGKRLGRNRKWPLGSIFGEPWTVFGTVAT